MENTDLIIKNLIQQVESDRIVIITKASPDDIAQTVTAFINDGGGDLLLGVDENRKVVGLVNAQQYRNEIRDYLSNHIDPAPPVSINLIIFNFKPLIIISAWEGANKPYTYKQQIYHRENGQNYTGDFKADLPFEPDSSFDMVSKVVETELKHIYDFIKEKGVANTSDIMQLSNKSLATAKRYLKILKERKLISFVGSANHKIGGYKVME